MEQLDSLISALKKFPGLGSKSAKRIAYYLLKQDDKYLSDLGALVSGLKKDLYTCRLCGNISSQDPCNICSNPLRDKNILCVVEDVEALSTFEQAGVYNGLYHVLGKKVAPASGYDLDDHDIDFLGKHLASLELDEVIIATNPKLEGDMTYYTLLDVLRSSSAKKITRLAFGLPVGGVIAFADKMTLHTAMEARRQVL